MHKVREQHLSDGPTSPYQNYSDEDLLARFYSRSERGAFEELAQRYHKFSFRLAVQVTKHSSVAEEAAQDAFLDVFQNKSRFVNKGEGSFKRWFAVVVMNHARKKVRSEQRCQRREELKVLDVSQRASKGGEQGSREMQSALNSAMGALEENYRIPIAMFFLEKMPQSEIAGVLGLSVRQIQNRISTGLDLLRKRMARRGIGLAAAGVQALLEEAQPLPVPEFESIGSGLGAGTSTAASGAMGGSKWVALTASVAFCGIAAFVLMRETTPSSDSAQWLNQKNEVHAVTGLGSGSAPINKLWTFENAADQDDWRIVVGSWKWRAPEGELSGEMFLASKGVTTIELKQPLATRPIELSIRCRVFEGSHAAQFSSVVIGEEGVLAKVYHRGSSTLAGDKAILRTILGTDYADEWVGDSHIQTVYFKENSKPLNTLRFTMDNIMALDEIQIRSVSEAKENLDRIRDRLYKVPLPKRQGIVFLSGCPSLLPQYPVHAVFGANSNPSKKVPDSFSSRHWTFASAKDLEDFSIFQGQWVHDRAKGTIHSKQISKEDKAPVVAALTCQPHWQLPVKITARVRPLSQRPVSYDFGVVWLGTRYSRFVRNVGEGKLQTSGWDTFTVYVTERYIDYLVNGERISIKYCWPWVYAPLGLTNSKPVEIDDIQIQKVTREEVPQFDKINSVLSKVTEDQLREGVRIPLKGLQLGSHGEAYIKK